MLLYATAAGASPLALTATFVVLRSERPRGNGIAFLSGFLLGTCIACGLGLFLGKSMIELFDSHETIEGVLTLPAGNGLDELVVEPEDVVIVRFDQGPVVVVILESMPLLEPARVLYDVNPLPALVAFVALLKWQVLAPSHSDRIELFERDTPDRLLVAHRELDLCETFPPGCTRSPSHLRGIHGISDKRHPQRNGYSLRRIAAPDSVNA